MAECKGERSVATRIDEEMNQFLEQESDAVGIPKAELIRRLFDSYHAIVDSKDDRQLNVARDGRGIAEAISTMERLEEENRELKQVVEDLTTTNREMKARLNELLEEKQSRGTLEELKDEIASAIDSFREPEPYDPILEAGPYDPTKEFEDSS